MADLFITNFFVGVGVAAANQPDNKQIYPTPSSGAMVPQSGQPKPDQPNEPKHKGPRGIFTIFSVIGLLVGVCMVSAGIAGGGLNTSTLFGLFILGLAILYFVARDKARSGVIGAHGWKVLGIVIGSIFISAGLLFTGGIILLMMALAAWSSGGGSSTSWSGGGGGK